MHDLNGILSNWSTRLFSKPIDWLLLKVNLSSIWAIFEQYLSLYLSSIWAIFEQYLSYIWAVFELFLSCIWAIFELYLSCIWAICELYLRYIWAEFELYLSCIWAIFEMYLSYIHGGNKFTNNKFSKRWHWDEPMLIIKYDVFLRQT